MTAAFSINTAPGITTWSTRPFSGLQSNTPVVGISAGRDSYQLRYVDYDGLPYLETAPSVLIEPPFNTPSEPVVRIETPE